MSIRYTYSDDMPQIERLQGGILYPHGIEQVEITGEDGPESQHRFKLLKFADNGEAISDYDLFTDQFKNQIDAQIIDGMDVQRLTAKHQNWMNKAGDKIRAHVRLGKKDSDDVPVRKRKG